MSTLFSYVTYFVQIMEFLNFNRILKSNERYDLSEPMSDKICRSY